MANIFGKLVRWRLRLLEFELDIFNREVIKHHGGDALQLLNAKGEDKKTMHNEVPVLAISQALFAYAPKTEITDFKFTKELRGSIVSFILEVCTIIVVRDNEEGKVQILPEFISAQYIDLYYSFAFASARKLNTSYSVDSNGELPRIVPLRTA